ncbi:MAG: glycosyltransferase family 4 protein [Candidatus Hydrogenedentota bacterium]
MRILHVIDHLGIGGAQAYLGQLLTHWPSSTDEIMVIPLSNKSSEIQSFRHAKPNIRILAPPSSSVSLRHLLDARQTIYNGEYDIVHAHLQHACLLASSVFGTNSQKLIMHAHGSIYNYSALRRRLLRFPYMKCDHIVANSNIVAHNLQQCYPLPPAKLSVVPCGVDTTVFSPDPITRVLKRNQLGLSNDTFLIGCIGRLLPIKGQHLLLEALIALNHHFHDWAAIIIGDGPMRDTLSRKIASSSSLRDRVSLIGSDPNVSAWTPAFDIAFLSGYRGMPITAMEAMATGVPVVVNDIPGVEQLIQDGHNGLLVNAESSVQTADAIHRLIADPELRKTLGDNGRETILHHFDIRLLAQNLRETYTRILGSEFPSIY